MESQQVINTALQQLNVLVAEDTLINRKLLELLFQQQNIPAHFVSDGQQVLELLKGEQQYDIILMDLEMPEMNGYNAAQYIRHILKSNIPMIAMSGHSDENERSKCLQIGFNEYVSKPIDMNTLYRKMYAFTQGEALSFKPSTSTNTLTTEQYINLHYLRSLSPGNPSFEKKILHIFQEDMPQQLDDLLACIAHGDDEGAGQLVHKIKSETKMLGMTILSRLLEELELDFAQGRRSKDFDHKMTYVIQMLHASFKELAALLR